MSRCTAERIPSRVRRFDFEWSPMGWAKKSDRAIATRACEPSVALPDGMGYNVILQADSVFTAAVLFYSH